MLDLIQPTTSASSAVQDGRRASGAGGDRGGQARRVRTIRAVRPSLIDLRFKGDAMVLAEDGGAALFLGQYCLSRVVASPFDLPALNHTWLRIRLDEARRQYFAGGAS